MVSVFLGVVAGRVFTRYGDEERRMARLLVLAGALNGGGNGAGLVRRTGEQRAVDTVLRARDLRHRGRCADGRLPARRPVGASAGRPAVRRDGRQRDRGLRPDVPHRRRAAAAPAAVVQPLQEALRPGVASVAYGVAFVLVSWALCERLYRRRTFIRLCCAG
jgi:hypothetical protein